MDVLVQLPGSITQLSLELVLALLRASPFLLSLSLGLSCLVVLLPDGPTGGAQPSLSIGLGFLLGLLAGVVCGALLGSGGGCGM